MGDPIFEDKGFVLNRNLAENTKKELQRLIFLNGGSLADLASSTHIVCDPAESFDGCETARLNNAHISVVKPEWVIDCAHQSRLLPLKGYCADLKFFEGITVTTTGVSTPDREKIAAGMRTFGGVFQADLDSNCTHLIANSNESEKYKVASECKFIHVVSVKWFNACLEERRRVPESEHLIGPPPDEEMMRKMRSWRASSISHLRPSLSARTSLAATASHSGGGGGGGPSDIPLMHVPPPTDGATVQGGQDLEDLRGSFQHYVFAVSNYGPEVTECILQNLRYLGAKASTEYSDDCTHLITRYKKGEAYQLAHANRKVIVTAHWLDDCIHTKRDVDTMAQAKVLYFPLPSGDGIPDMKKMVVAVTGYLDPDRTHLKYLIRSTGATYTGSLASSNTHLICKVPSGMKYTKAKEWGVKIVNAKWIEDCVLHWAHLDESNYLGWDDDAAMPQPTAPQATFAAPAQTLGPGALASAPRAQTPPLTNTTADATITQKPTSAVEAPSDVSTATNGRATTPPLPPPLESRKEAQQQQQLPVKIESPALKPATPPPPPPPPLPSTAAEPAPAVVKKEKEKEKEEKSKTAHGKRKSGEMLKAEVDHESSSPSGGGGGSIELEPMSDNHVAPKPKRQKKEKEKAAEAPATAGGGKKKKSPKGRDMKFLLSSELEKNSAFVQKIKDLGGTMCAKGVSYDDSCTHILLSDLKRTERFFCGCAAGKWILQPSFIDASFEEGSFVEEEPHEWYGDKEEGSDGKVLWKGAARRFRTQRAESGVGPFEGWTVVAHGDGLVPKPEAIEKIISAGGGTVEDINEAKADPSSVKYVFVPKGHKASDKALRPFFEAGVPCVDGNFLLESIARKEPPAVESFAISGPSPTPSAKGTSRKGKK